MPCQDRFSGIPGLPVRCRRFSSRLNPVMNRLATAQGRISHLVEIAGRRPPGEVMVGRFRRRGRRLRGRAADRSSQPLIFRMTICPEARSARNSMGTVSASAGRSGSRCGAGTPRSAARVRGPGRFPLRRVVPEKVNNNSRASSRLPATVLRFSRHLRRKVRRLCADGVLSERRIAHAQPRRGIGIVTDRDERKTDQPPFVCHRPRVDERQPDRDEDLGQTNRASLKISDPAKRPTAERSVNRDAASRNKLLDDVNGSAAPPH